MAAAAEYLIDDGELLIHRMQSAWIACDEVGIAEMVFGDTGVQVDRSSSFSHINNHYPSTLLVNTTPKALRRSVAPTVSSSNEELSNATTVVATAAAAAAAANGGIAMSFDISMSPSRMRPSSSHNEKERNDKSRETRCKTISFNELKKRTAEQAPDDLAATEARVFSTYIEDVAAKKKYGGRLVDNERVQKGKLSLLSAMFAEGETKRNVFAVYNKHSGEGHQGGAALVVKREIFPAFSKDKKPLNIIVLGGASVEQVTGLALFKYAEEGREPELIPRVDAYCLRMVEDDGEPDMDIPVLDNKQPIFKFEFDQLALCELPNARTTEKHVDDSEKSLISDSKQVTTFVRVYCPPQGCSILHVKSLDIVMKDVLTLVLRKRAVTSIGYHTLELCDQPGIEVNLDLTLKAFNTHEFNLINKHSKRTDVVEDFDVNEDIEVHHSLTTHQYKSWIVYKLHKFGGKQQTMLGIDGEKISVIPYGSVGINFPGRSFKLQTYDMSAIVRCLALEEKGGRMVRLTSASSSPNAEFKNHDFECKSRDDAKEMVSKINCILDSQRSEQRNQFTMRESVKHKKSGLFGYI